MIANSVIRRLIREDKAHEIHPHMEMGKLEGMHTMDQSIAGMVRNNLVTRDEAMIRCDNPAKLNSLINLRSEMAIS